MRRCSSVTNTPSTTPARTACASASRVRKVVVSSIRLPRMSSIACASESSSSGATMRNRAAEVTLADAPCHFGQSHDRRRQPQPVDYAGDGRQHRDQQTDHDHHVAIAGRGAIELGNRKPGVEQRDGLTDRIDHDGARCVLLEGGNSRGGMIAIGQRSGVQRGQGIGIRGPVGADVLQRNRRRRFACRPRAAPLRPVPAASRPQRPGGA